MDKELIKNMRQAIKQGDIIATKNMLENNEELLDTATPFGTWLQVAAAHGQMEIVRFLIECGMDINESAGISEGGPIKNAAFNGHLDIVKLLYEHGAVLDVREATKNPLFAAIYNGHLDVVRFLVEKGINLKAYYAIGDLEKVDAYEYAKQYGQTEIANYLKKIEQ